MRGVCGKVGVGGWLAEEEEEEEGAESHQPLRERERMNACPIVHILSIHPPTHPPTAALVLTLVGNKADCGEEKRQVARAEAEALATHHGMECRSLLGGWVILLSFGV